MPRLAAGLGLSILLVVSSSVIAAEPKQGSGVGEVLRRILTPSPQPPTLPQATQAAAIPVRLVPNPAHGTVTNRFLLDAAATIAPANADLQLVSVPANPAFLLEIGFEVAMEGVRFVEFDCQLLEFETWRGGRNESSTRVKAVNRLVQPVSGPFSGRLTMGFAPFEPVNPIDMLGNPIRYPMAVCRMEASGSALGSNWSTHRALAGDIRGANGSTEYLGLFDQSTGRRLQSQLLVARPATTLVAVPEEVINAYN